VNKLTLKQAIELFLLHLQKLNYSPLTVLDYRNALNQLLDYLTLRYPQVELGAITLDTLSDYYRFLAQTPYVESSKANRLSTVRCFFRFLKKRDWIVLDPAEGLPSFKIPHDHQMPTLSQGEVELLFSKPNLKTLQGFRDRTIMEVLYSSALRGRELCGLTFYDVDPQKGWVRVLEGKGKKDRVVPLGKIACQFVKEYLEIIRPQLLRGQSSNVLFIDKKPKPFHPNRLASILRNYVKQCNFSKPVSCHTFRRTCATAMLKGGSSIYHVQEMLGHANLATTQIYTPLTPVDLKEAQKKAHPRERLKNKEAPPFQPGDKPRYYNKPK